MYTSEMLAYSAFILKYLLTYASLLFINSMNIVRMFPHAFVIR